MSKLDYITHPKKLIGELKLILDSLQGEIDQLIVFGSLTKGNFLIHSDVDILAVVNSEHTEDKIRKILDSFLLDLGIPYDLITISPEEFRIQESSQLIKEALQDGVILWENEKTD